jgi:hypothetical protein
MIAMPEAKSEVASSDYGPFPKIRSLLRLTQCTLPLDAGVFFGAAQNGVSDFEVVMDYATKSGCVDTWELLRWRFADWANEGHQLLPGPFVCSLSLGGVRRRRDYSTANASLATFGILHTPATPAPRLTIGIACHRWLPNPSFVK